MNRILKNIGQLLAATLKKAFTDDIVTHGAAIAFYTIFSITPLFILVISLASLFISEDMINEQIRLQMTGLIGVDMTSSLESFLTQNTLAQTEILTSVIATTLIIFGATTVISQLKLSLNKIWNISNVKIHTVWHYLLNRLISFGMILLFSLILLISLLTEGVIGLISSTFYDLFPGVPLDLYLYLSQLSTIGFAVIFFTLIFKILPDVHVAWLDILVGALVTTLLFLLGKFLIGQYLSATGLQASYKTAGTLVILVVWVYYNIQTILLGAVFTQVYTVMFGKGILPYKYVEIKKQNSEF